MKIKRLLFLFVFVSLPIFAVYQDQGMQGMSQFPSIYENSDFLCTGQCFFSVDPLVKNDFIIFDGVFQGSGVIGYGILLDGKLSTGEIFPLYGGKVLFTQQAFSLNSLSHLLPLSKDTQVVFFVDGMIRGNSIHITLHTSTFYQHIFQGWNDFWHMETLDLYSTFMRYGVKIFDISIVQYGYIIFLVAVIFILFMTKGSIRKKFRKIFFWGIGLFFFIGIRNMITYVWIVDQGIHRYTIPVWDQKIFFNLGAYYSFTYKIRKELHLDTTKQSCTIYIDSTRQTFFMLAREYQYFKPCTVVLTGSQADYIVYYETPVSLPNSNKPILIKYKGSYLIANKESSQISGSFIQ